MVCSVRLLYVFAFYLCIGSGSCIIAQVEPYSQTLTDGWMAKSPRAEITPEISYAPNESDPREITFSIQHDAREGLDGWVEKQFAVEGNSYYRFSTQRKLENVPVPRRSALVRVKWLDENDNLVQAGDSVLRSHRYESWPTAEPEHPSDGPMDEQGHCVVEGTFLAPPAATQAIVELHLQWTPNGRVEWSNIQFSPTAASERRIVRLAAVHYRPQGKSPHANCEEYVPLISEAAKNGAQLVVLGETVPYVGVNLQPSEIAEPIPGPTSDYFSKIAASHRIHLVVSLYERQDHLIYNSAILLGPEGQIIGKYRKTCLPHGEVEKGIAPGYDFPVFDTAIGKIGMMICYDGFFPEVARELTNRGAEIIAWPVWGCNPMLAAARACENHVIIVSSTYMPSEDNWMISAVFDQNGEVIAQAKEWNTVAVAEVDLSRPYIGPWNLGDFRSMIDRHRPLDAQELQLHRTQQAIGTPKDKN